MAARQAGGRKAPASGRGHGAVLGVETVKAGPYTVEVTRKRIRRLYMRFDDPAGPVRVSAPASTPLSEIVRFVLSESEWIDRRAAELANSAPASARRGHIGADGRVLLWGEPVDLARLTERGALLFGTGMADDAERLLAPVLFRELSRATLPLVLDRQCSMGIAGPMIDVRFRDMSTRWGSCKASDRRVTFALSLAHYPPECLELIVVHELCHFFEHGHGDAFKALMTRHLPDWRERDALLKRLSRGR